MFNEYAYECKKAELGRYYQLYHQAVKEYLDKWGDSLKNLVDMFAEKIEELKKEIEVICQN